MKIYLKMGMAGSRCGKGRREHTEVLKKFSKKLRRREGKSLVQENLRSQTVSSKIS